jgi:hypothetical protein
MADAVGLIRVVSDAEMQQTEQRVADDQTNAAREANSRPVLQGLAGYVNQCWTDAYDAKQAVLPRLQKAHRARVGEYEPAKLAMIREFGGSEVYLRVIANKCRILESWLKDVYLGQTDKPWTLAASPKPSVPADIEKEVRAQLAREIAAVYTQLGTMPDQIAVRAAEADMRDAAEERLRDVARKAVERMERRMEDQLMEGGFPTAMASFISDFVTYPTAVVKGPVLRQRKQIAWQSGAGGKMAPVVTDQIIPDFERVDPFRAYPAAGAGTPQDGYFIEHLSLSYDELYAMLGSPGVNEEALRAALKEAEGGGLANWIGWSEANDTPDKDNVAYHLKRKVFNIDALLFYGPVRGSDLIEWANDAKDETLVADITDPDATHEAAVWLVGSWVIKAHLNYDPLGVRPYYSASYNNVPGAFWGESVPDILEDVGDVVSAVGRALVNNAGFASGPMVGLNVDRLQDGEKISTLTPWQIFQLADSQYGNSSDRPIEFYQPQMHAQELLAIIDKFYQFADDFSMIPRYMAGSDKVAGAGRTASGLSMLMDAANKGLKAAVSNIDAALAQLLEKLYNHNMIFDPDETIKGDAQVVARGATSLMQLESLRLRRNEFLMATNNPTDTQIIGLGGRAEILRATAKDLEMDTTRIVPPREKFAAQAMQAAQPSAQLGPQPSSPGQGQPGPHMSQEVLGNGAPTTDNFSPSSMTQGYAEGGLVQERIDSGTGPNWQNSVGYADPSQQFASALDSAQREANWSQGHQLSGMQKERRAEDMSELAGLKANAVNFEKANAVPSALTPSSSLGLVSKPAYQDTGPGGKPPPAPPGEDPAAQPLSFGQKPKRQSILGSGLGSGLL